MRARPLLVRTWQCRYTGAIDPPWSRRHAHVLHPGQRPVRPDRPAGPRGVPAGRRRPRPTDGTQRHPVQRPRRGRSLRRLPRPGRGGRRRVDRADRVHEPVPVPVPGGHPGDRPADGRAAGRVHLQHDPAGHPRGRVRVPVLPPGGAGVRRRAGCRGGPRLRHRDAPDPAGRPAGRAADRGRGVPPGRGGRRPDGRGLAGGRRPGRGRPALDQRRAARRHAPELEPGGGRDPAAVGGVDAVRRHLRRVAPADRAAGRGRDHVRRPRPAPAAGGGGVPPVRPDPAAGRRPGRGRGRPADGVLVRGPRDRARVQPAPLVREDARRPVVGAVRGQRAGGPQLHELPGPGGRRPVVVLPHLPVPVQRPGAVLHPARPGPVRPDGRGRRSGSPTRPSWRPSCPTPDCGWPSG